MTKLIVLGSANAIPDVDHENTHLAIVGKQEVVLIDCVGSPTVRLTQAGIELDSITELILTHFHPDHVSGVPLLLMNMWLLGRQKPLRIYGLHHCLKRVEDMMGSYHWEDWPNFFPVAFHRLPERDHVQVLENDEFRILASPVRHLIPTIGLRIERLNGEGVIAYSSDTEPCAAVVELASGADILIHEAAGGGMGHSTPHQAGGIARQAEVGKLLLIHYPTIDSLSQRWLAEARQAFPGEVDLAHDFMEIEL